MSNNDKPINNNIGNMDVFNSWGVKTKDVVVRIPCYTRESGVCFFWESGYAIKVEILGDAIGITANREGLISLASHCLNLAQDAIAPFDCMEFDEFNSLEEGFLPLILQRDDSLGSNDINENESIG